MLIKILERQHRAWLLAGALVMILGIGWLDYVSSDEISLSIFYLLPVGILAWTCGNMLGLGIAAISAAVALVADLYAPHPKFSHIAIPFWNFLVRFGFFAIVSFLMTSLRSRTQALERLNQDLDNFARMVSHDLREPLHTLEGFLDLYIRRQKAKADAKSEQYFKAIMQATRRMDTLIRELLDFSRLGYKADHFTRVNGSEILDEVLNNLQHTIQERSAIITNDSLPTLICDAPRLALVFQNLIANAIKFCKDRTPEIKISVTDNGDAWQFTVADNGIGIDGKHHKVIFDTFQRLHSNQEYPGVGMGLAICKKIIGHHGGGIWVHSKVAQGAQFHFTIPKHLDASTSIQDPGILWKLAHLWQRPHLRRRKQGA